MLATPTSLMTPESEVREPVGLTSAEAAARLRRFGPNVAEPPRRLEAFRELLRYLANPLVLVDASDAGHGQYATGRGGDPVLGDLGVLR